MAKSESSKPQASVPWAENDVLVLLTTLNLNIREIRSKIEQGGRRAILDASKLLSEAIGDECTQTRVDRKIRQLWTSRGVPDGDKGPVDVYVYGAFSKTLPGLDKVLLGKVATRVKELQEAPESPKTQAGIPVSLLRRSARTTVQNPEPIQTSPANCQCGFTHDILWIQCDQCFTRQHAYCYYGTEDKDQLPKPHICAGCQTPVPPGLDAAVSKLRVEDEEAPVGNEQGHARRLSGRRGAPGLGPFGRPGDKKTMRGPQPEETEECLVIVASRLHEVANDLEPEVDFDRLCEAAAAHVDTAFLLERSLGSDYHTKAPSLIQQAQQPGYLRRCLLKSMLNAALMNWVCVPSDTPPSLASVMLKLYQQEVLSTNGIEVLESVHRTVYKHMMFSPEFESLLDYEANLLVNRFWTAITPMIRDQENPKAWMNDWTSSIKYELSRHQILVSGFSSMLKLNRQLALAGNWHEFYSPEPSSTATTTWMVLEAMTDVDPSQTIEFCLRPAVFEYPREFLQEYPEGVDALLGERSQVRVSDEMRTKGTVITPAVVHVS